MQARDYQEWARQSIFDYFGTNTGNPIVALPTGTGKSFVIADFIKTALFRYPSTRIMKLTHVKELIRQNFDELKAVWPNAPAGIFSAGLRKKEYGFPIIFGGMGTIVNVDLKIFGRIDLLLIDECHLLSPKDTTTYQLIINRLKVINPLLKVIGLTATPYRLGQGLLTENGIFTHICFDMTRGEAFTWFIDNGYLVPLIPPRTETVLDITGVSKRGGEYVLKELQEAVDKAELTQKVVEETIAIGQNNNRRHWLVFATGVDHTRHVMEAYNDYGVKATCVHSKMSDKERDKNLIDYRTGKYQCMINNGILTTGYNFPAIDFISVMRHTESASLWVQILGRGTRPVFAPGFDLTTRQGRLDSIRCSQKQNCLVADFARNILRLGPVNDPVLPKPKGSGGGGAAPIKVCEYCGVFNHAAVRFCINCQGEFPLNTDPKIDEKAVEKEFIKREEPPELADFSVDRVTYAYHQRGDRLPSLKVSYFCGLRKFDEWITLEHTGLPGKRARDWWRDASIDNEEPPETVEQSLEMLDHIRIPKRLTVWVNKKYPEIISRIY